MITLAQMKAGRAWLNWSQSDLADKAGLSQTGIARIETAVSTPQAETMRKIEEALGAAGIVFISGGIFYQPPT